jgi:phage major head subunit gpT-like protein
MGSGIAGSNAQEALNTAFLAVGEEMFSKRGDSTYGLISMSVPAVGMHFELDALGATGIVRELVGSRRFANLRAYSRRVKVKTYAADALEIPILNIETDKSGLLAAKLAAYAQSASNFFEKPVIDEFLSNPVGIDGVALIGTTHPYANGGGTWSNDAAAALTPDSFNTAIKNMTSLFLENGEPAGFFPTHLYCGPALRKMAFDLCESDTRPMPLAATGLEAYASAVAATNLPNWMKGKIQVVIEPRFANGTNDTGWVLMDLSRPGCRPMAVGEARAPGSVIVDDPGSEPRLHRASNAYYVEGAMGVAGFMPHCIHGSLDGA